MSPVYRIVRCVLILLALIFSIAYPIALIGMTFNVTPPFSFGWAGSALLVLEACMLFLAAALTFDWLRAWLAALTVIMLSTLVEEIGVSTAFPFGAYFYTNVLQPRITSQVPLAVSFAWVLVIFASYGIVRMGYVGKDHIGLCGTLLGAMLATALDLAIEPVAVYIERYWVWIRPGSFSYYGVPLTNFVAWFLVAWILMTLVDMQMRLLLVRIQQPDVRFTHSRLTRSIPLLLFSGSLFMFGLVDLTHGYYMGTLFAALPSLLAMRKRIARSMIMHKKNLRYFGSFLEAPHRQKEGK